MVPWARPWARCVAAPGEVRGYVTTIDGETNDPANLNRYPLATQADLGTSKSELTAAFLRRGGLEAYAYLGRWPEYASDPNRSPQRDDVRELEAHYRYPLVLSCVDRNTARHGIQNFWPAFLMGGSTPGFALEVDAYDMHSPYECLKCFNRPEPAGPSNNEIAAELRALPQEERCARAEARGANWQALEAYLANPKCGRLGAAEISKFRDEAVDWSVGFLSVAAGTLLAAQLLRYALIGRAAFPIDKGNALRFNFFNPAPRWTKHARRAECDCARRRAGRFRASLGRGESWHAVVEIDDRACQSPARCNPHRHRPAAAAGSLDAAPDLASASSTALSCLMPQARQVTLRSWLVLRFRKTRVQ